MFFLEGKLEELKEKKIRDILQDYFVEEEKIENIKIAINFIKTFYDQEKITNDLFE